MKRLVFFLLVFTLLAGAQVSAPTHATIASGGTWDVPNPYGALTTSWEEIPVGTPTAVSVTIAGCMRGTTCDSAADTNTSTSAAIRGVTFTKPYSYFHVAVTVTKSGESPTVTVNPFLVH
jgi:hypothetical protein